MTRFMSKNPRLNIVLRPAIPADPISGRQGVPGLYILFENHEATIENQEILELLLKHSGFNRDFFKVSEENVDELLKKQQLNPSEPPHAITDLGYGRIGETIGNKPVKLNPEMRKLISELATEAAKEQFARYVEEYKKTNTPIVPLEEGRVEPEEVTVESKLKKTKKN